MGRTIESLKVFRKAIRKYEDTIRHYKGLFLSDGRIDSNEQALLDKIQNMILLVKEEIEKREARLSDREKKINELARSLKIKVTNIGKITKSKGIKIFNEEKRVYLKQKGYNHFKK